MTEIAITQLKLTFLVSVLNSHLTTFKHFDAIEKVTGSFVEPNQIVTVVAQRGSFPVKGTPYTSICITISVFKCVWFTALSLFDVRNQIAMAPPKTCDKVAMGT